MYACKVWRLFVFKKWCHVGQQLEQIRRSTKVGLVLATRPEMSLWTCITLQVIQAQCEKSVYDIFEFMPSEVWKPVYCFKESHYWNVIFAKEALFIFTLPVVFTTSVSELKLFSSLLVPSIAELSQQTAWNVTTKTATTETNGNVSVVTWWFWWCQHMVFIFGLSKSYVK